jgi:uncharacterized protein (DUF924 family)
MSPYQSILEYWFADCLLDARRIPARAEFWFGTGNSAVDEDIRVRFGGVVEAALNDAFDSWTDEPHGRLALILLLDQFTRSIYRGTPRAFVGDARALALTEDGLRSGTERKLQHIERVFFLMPLQHAESLAVQDRSVRAFEALPAHPEERAFHARCVDYAHRHRLIIARFGRFPHRNAVLGRADSPAETQYLRDNPEHFGQ